MSTKKSGVELIAEERQRQIEKEGWTSEHDAMHQSEEMIDAAMCYLMSSPDMEINAGTAYVQLQAKKAIWPWAIGQFKPSPDNRLKELVKAGALIAAEIDNIINNKI